MWALRFRLSNLDRLRTMVAMRLTLTDWLIIYERMTGRRVLDPDGFRIPGTPPVQGRVDYYTTYTLDEFMERVVQCTIGPVNVAVAHQVSDTADGTDSVGPR